MHRPPASPMALSEEHRLRNNTDFARRLMLERYGRYPDDHPSAAFLREIPGRINGRTEINLILTRNWGDKNAVALDRMARTAGFSNVFEAYFYQPASARARLLGCGSVS